MSSVKSMPGVFPLQSGEKYLAKDGRVIVILRVGKEKAEGYIEGIRADRPKRIYTSWHPETGACSDRGRENRDIIQRL